MGAIALRSHSSGIRPNTLWGSIMRKQFYAGVATIAIVAATPVFAQSSGSIAVEDIIVTAQTGDDGLSGIVVPDATKARGIITQELITTQAAGQTVLNTINLIPGVNFTNSDAYGSSGGNIRIRGFDGNRISLTFDGFPLNDTGNYAIYPNQQLDPELVEQVNVNLGTTDIDSPTASAAGGTVNYRTILGSKELEAIASMSVGENDYTRAFGMLNFGELNESGTRLWMAASTARNDKFKGPGRIEKQQYNAKIYQPIGDNGDFISLAGHYNQNRNNFYRNPSVNDMRTLFGSAVIPLATAVSSAAPLDLSTIAGYQLKSLFNFENDAVCVNARSLNGSNANCTNYYNVRINPSNTGNARFNSRFTVTDQLTLTADASFQYTLANGGGYTLQAENAAFVKGSLTTGSGVDFNGDGDTSDSVPFFTPNNTNTRRWTAMASAIYELSPEHRVRLAYTFDRGRHRQTGEWAYLDSAGNPESPFAGLKARQVLAADGNVLRQRDRLSIAMLNQIAGQYIGKFMDDALRVEIGVRAPFFKRDLTNYCYTQTSTGNGLCTTQPVSTLTVVSPTATTLPSGSVYAPFAAKYKFNKVLPNVGLTYKATDDISIFASYAVGYSAPRTDNLYRKPLVSVAAETTDAFDLGLRYTTSKIQAQLTGWYIGYQNRIVTSFDPDQGISVDRNVGKVKTYGFDANLGYQVIEPVTLYAFASYNNSKLQQNIEIGKASGVTIFAPTAGKFVTETPRWSFGGRASVDLGALSVGLQGKYVGDRYATDVNDVKSPSYTLFDLNARYSFEDLGFKKTFFQLNVINLFNKFYFGNISTQISHGTIGGISGANPNFSVGSPRTIMGTLQIGF